MADKEIDLGLGIIALTLGAIAVSIYREAKREPGERITRPELYRAPAARPEYKTTAAALAALLHGDSAKPRFKEVPLTERDLSWLHET